MNVPPLLKAAAELRLESFLLRRPAHAHLVAPAFFIDYLRSREAEPAFSHATDLDGRLPRFARRLIVYHPSEERRWLAAAAERHPQVPAWGVMRHVVPALITDRRLQESVPASFEPAGLALFAVIGLGRSGSTYLCELLHGAGLGRPREHWREPLAHVLASGAVDEAAVLREICWRGREGEVFGTKLLWYYLRAAGRDEAPRRLERLAQTGFRFIHLRRDLTDQAASHHVASHTRTWHVREHLPSSLRERIEAVPYEFERLQRIHADYAGEEAELTQALQRLAPERILHVRYEELERDPIGVVRRIAHFLGREPQLDAIHFAQLPRKISGEVPHARAIAERFRAERARLAEGALS